MGWVVVVLNAGVGDAGSVGQAGVVAGLGDWVSFWSDLVMTPQGGDIADPGHDL